MYISWDDRCSEYWNFFPKHVRTCSDGQGKVPKTDGQLKMKNIVNDVARTVRKGAAAKMKHIVIPGSHGENKAITDVVTDIHGGERVTDYHQLIEPFLTLAEQHSLAMAPCLVEAAKDGTDIHQVINSFESPGSLKEDTILEFNEPVMVETEVLASDVDSREATLKGSLHQMTDKQSYVSSERHSGRPQEGGPENTTDCVQVCLEVHSEGPQEGGPEYTADKVRRCVEIQSQGVHRACPQETVGPENTTDRVRMYQEVLSEGSQEDGGQQKFGSVNTAKRVWMCHLSPVNGCLAFWKFLILCRLVKGLTHNLFRLGQTCRRFASHQRRVTAEDACDSSLNSSTAEKTVIKNLSWESGLRQSQEDGRNRPKEKSHRSGEKMAIQNSS